MRRLVIGFVGFVIVFVTPCGAKAEESPAKMSPLQIAIWNPVQLVPDDWDVWGLRLNLLYGNNRDVVGIDLGLVNSASALEGVQLGLWNDVGSVVSASPVGAEFSNARGIQIGLVNYNMGNFTGVQIAGWGNNSRTFTGVQATSLLNSTLDGGRGLQAALICNANGMHGVPLNHPWRALDKTFTGIEMAGLWNNNEVPTRGVQVALLVNRANDMTGVQIGLVNYCETMIGVQIGLVNIIKESAVPFLPMINAHF